MCNPNLEPTIFKEVRASFQKMQREVQSIQRQYEFEKDSGDSLAQTRMPDCVIVNEYQSATIADQKSVPDSNILGQFKGDIRKSTCFMSEKEYFEQEIREQHDFGELRGMLYQNGLFQFGMEKDSSLIYLTMTYGPRYGRGAVYKLEKREYGGYFLNPTGPAWIS